MAHRISLIHAVSVAIEPINAAFKQLWPEADIYNLLEDSLSPDLERTGSITAQLKERFLRLSEYSIDCGASAVLFTCSAFGSAIDYTRERVSVPVLKPNEAMIEDAITAGPRLGLLSTFEPTLNSMRPEIEAMAKKHNRNPMIQAVHVKGALEALRGGDAERHDALIAEAAGSLNCDAILLSQFSMARAASRVRERVEVPVLTSPDSAVLKLKGILSA